MVGWLAADFKLRGQKEGADARKSRRCSLSSAFLVVLFITTLFLSRCLVPRYSGCPSPQSSGTGDFQQVEQDL